MANGAKFSQIGVDISKASDHELHFDSGWPTMHVMAGGTLTKTVAGTAGTPFYKHGLGYVPAFLPYTYDAISGEYEIFRAIMTADKTNIYYYPPGGGGASIDVTYGLFIYNIDLEKNYLAPSINPNPQTVGGDEANFGIAVAIEGSNIRSRNMQDFKVNTAARAPLIHAISHGLATEPSFAGGVRNYSYTHNLPYNPMFFPYIEASFAPGQYMIVANFAGTNTIGKTISLIGINNGFNASIVVLKDPFNAAENTTEISI